MTAFDARLKQAASFYGEFELASRGAALILSGDEDDEFLGYVGLGGAMPSYLTRSWGARALEHYWVDDAVASVVLGLGDDYWRVRGAAAGALSRVVILGLSVAEGSG
jgi:hypothetical protein